MQQLPHTPLRRSIIAVSALIVISLFIPAGDESSIAYLFLNPYLFFLVWCIALTALLIAPLWYLADKRNTFRTIDYLFPFLPYLLWTLLVFIESPGHEGLLELPIILVFTLLFYRLNIFLIKHSVRTLIALLILTVVIRFISHTAVTLYPQFLLI